MIVKLVHGGNCITLCKCIIQHLLSLVLVAFSLYIYFFIFLYLYFDLYLYLYVYLSNFIDWWMVLVSFMFRFRVDHLGQWGYQSKCLTYHKHFPDSGWTWNVRRDQKKSATIKFQQNQVSIKQSSFSKKAPDPKWCHLLPLPIQTPPYICVHLLGTESHTTSTFFEVPPLCERFQAKLCV